MADKERRKPKPYVYRNGWRAQVTLPSGKRPYEDFEKNEFQKAEKWIDDMLEEAKVDKQPLLGGPRHATVAQALVQYAHLYTITKGGANAELDRINHYLVGAGMKPLKRVLKDGKTELVERDDEKQKDMPSAFKAHKEQRLRKRKGTYKMIGELARTRCSALSQVNIRALMVEMEKEGLSHSTVQKEVALLKHLFNMAAGEWNWTGFENPCVGIKLKKSNHRFVVLTSQEKVAMRKALSECDSPYFWQLVEVCLQTTLRLGSLLALSRSNVDLEGRVTYIPSKTGPVPIPLTLKAVEMLRGLPEHPSGLYFPISGNAVDMAWEGVRMKLGRPELQFRDLRHVGATDLARAGASAHQLMRMLGHKNTLMAEVYVNLASGDMLEFLDRIAGTVAVFDLPDPVKGTAGQLLKERRSKRLADAAMKVIQESQKAGAAQQRPVEQRAAPCVENHEVGEESESREASPQRSATLAPASEEYPGGPQEPKATGTHGVPPSSSQPAGMVIHYDFKHRR